MPEVDGRFPSFLSCSAVSIRLLAIMSLTRYLAESSRMCLGSYFGYPNKGLMVGFALDDGDGVAFVF